MSIDTGNGAAGNWRENLPAWAEDVAARARNFDPDTLSNREVVAMATGLALALGTFLAALGPAAPDPPPAGRVTKGAGRSPARRVTAGAAGEPIVAVVEGKKVSARTQRQLRRQIEALQGGIGYFEKLAKRQREERDPISAENVLIPVKQQEVAMNDDSVVAVLKNGKLTRRSRKELHKQVNALQKDIDRLGKAVEKESRRNQRRAAIADARDTLTGAVSETSDNAGKRLAAAGAATAAAVTPLLERARKSDLPDQVRSNARHFAEATRDRTSNLSDRFRGDLVPLVADRAGKVQDRVRGDFLPQVAEQLSHLRDDLVPQVAERLQHVRDDLAPQVADVAAKAGATVGALAASGAAVSRETAKTISKGDLAKTVDQRTRRGRKQAASALHGLAAQLEPPKQKRNLNGLWIFAIVAAIGGALYYYVFQNEERRKKVVETTKSLVEQGREIVRDFQGYDEEF